MIDATALSKLLNEGGWVLMAICFMSLVAWSQLIWAWLSLRGNDVFAESFSFKPLERDDFELLIMPHLRSHLLELKRPLRMSAVLATAMPLFGLLGTVLGMMVTFEALTDRGIAETDALAGGISQALITTQAGLLLALPVLLTHYHLSGKVRHYGDQMQQRLRQQLITVQEDTNR